MTRGDIIFLVGKDHTLVTMKNEPYESEDLLQTIVEKYPEVLTGGEDGGGKRLALVKREHAVADQADGGWRWSLDHLFLDEDAIPTLVEVKRATDTRIRREVVGQMLDYAANGVKYWPIADLRQRFAESRADRGAEAALQQLVGPEVEPEEFWRRVQDNLAAGRIRMVFLADEIPSELQRIIEFLNEQMSRTEVIGVEVRQYVNEELRTLVPRSVGSTAQARQTKSQVPRKTLEQLLEEAPAEVRELEGRLRSWALVNNYVIKRKPAALRFETQEGIGLVLLYPAWQVVEIYLATMWDQGLTSEAKAIQDRASTLAERRLTARAPWIPCSTVLANWDEFEREILPKYVNATLEANRLALRREPNGTDEEAPSEDPQPL